MRRFLSALIASLVLVLTSAAPLAASPQTDHFQAGTLLSIDKQVVKTPMSYVFDVVATYYETVTYKMQVHVGRNVYSVEYAPPVQPDGPLPSEWKENAPVSVRVEGRIMKFRVSTGQEIEGRIVGRKKV
jgi:hypothetical protein